MLTNAHESRLGLEPGFKEFPVGADCGRQAHLTYPDTPPTSHGRPHEALTDETPVSRWHSSARPLPTRIIPPSYPGHFEVRRVSTAGTFRLHNGQQCLTQALNGEMIGLEEVQDGRWNVIDDETLLGRFDEHTRTITGAPSLKNDCSRCPRTECHLSSRLYNLGAFAR